jgi:predicted ribosome quality control (RQC) complex YloA/Tae2 family protein
MDIFSIEAVVAELAKELPGSRLNKVHQPAEDTLILRLWTGRRELRLLASVAPHLARLNLTTRSYPNPFTPPRFCQLLRSRLGAVMAVEQVPGERIVRVIFRGKNGEFLHLVFEFTGSRGNLILTDEQGKIIDSLYRAEGEVRPVLPGVPYVLPPALPRLSLDDPNLEVPETCSDERTFREWLMARIAPMSPLVARELGAHVAAGAAPVQVLSEFREQWRNKKFQPMVATLEGKQIISPFRLSALPVENISFFPTFSEAADQFYHPLAFLSGAIGDRDELAASVRRELKRLSSRLEKIGREKEHLSAFDQDRIRGELLLANLHKVHKGMKEVIVENYYVDPPGSMTIDLDPRLSPQENAQRCFKGFKKGKRGIGHVDRRVEETLGAQRWLESVALAIDQAEGPDELRPIRQELVDAGLLRTKVERGRKERPTAPDESVRQIVSPGGYRLCWGKNNRANDHVSKHLTAPEDLWFHAHNLPGCHLVLKRGDKAGEVPEEDILFAAAIAAGYSRGREDTKVEVMVTEGKWVRKPKGARPGLVTVEKFRTVLVPPRVTPEDG